MAAAAPHLASPGPGPVDPFTRPGSDPWGPRPSDSADGRSPAPIQLPSPEVPSVAFRSAEGDRFNVKGVLKVELPKAKMPTITGDKTEDLERKFRLFERRIRIPNNGRDPPDLDRLEMLKGICSKDAEREAENFTEQPQNRRMETEGRYAEVYTMLKRYLLDAFQRPLLERQQAARAWMDEWSMGAREFATFQAGWRELLEKLREVGLEAPEDTASREQRAGLLNLYLAKLRKDVRAHCLLHGGTLTEVSQAEVLGRRYCSAQDSEAAIQAPPAMVKAYTDAEEVSAVQWDDAWPKLQVLCPRRAVAPVVTPLPSNRPSALTAVVWAISRTNAPPK